MDSKLKKYNILVTGANGQLGSEIKYLVQHSTFNIQNYNFHFTDINELDIANKLDVEQFICSNDINIIINCASFTNVDKAEYEEEKVSLVNFKAAENIAIFAKKYDIFLIQISTDYVFDGKNYSPYIETDKVNPINVYGQSKLKAEESIKKINPNKSIIIRTSWMYSKFGNNFVKTMIRLGKEKDELGVIFDQVGTPTYARDLAAAIIKVMSYELGVMNEKNVIHNSQFTTQNSVRVYHYSNEGVCSWYDFAIEIMNIAGIDCKINPIETKDYPTPAKRPYYSVLNKGKIKKDFGIEIPHWKESLKLMLNGKF